MFCNLNIYSLVVLYKDVARYMFVRFLTSITDVTPEEFISQSPEKQSKYYQMKKLLSEIISVQLENIHIFSVLNSPSHTQGVDVWFAVYGPPYYKAEKLNGNVAASRAWVSTHTTYKTTSSSHFLNSDNIHCLVSACA